jgi:hypothetical protein
LLLPLFAGCPFGGFVLDPLGAGVATTGAGAADVVGGGADWVVTGAGAEWVVTGAEVVDEGVVDAGLGLWTAGLWWWVALCRALLRFAGSVVLVCEVAGVVAGDEAADVELVCEADVPPQPATATAATIVLSSARFIDPPPILRSKARFSRVQDTHRAGGFRRRHRSRATVAGASHFSPASKPTGPAAEPRSAPASTPPPRGRAGSGQLSG